MKKQIAIAAIAAVAALSSAAAMAQTAAPEGAAPAVKKHPIKKRLHKIGTALKAKHAPAAPETTKP